MPVSNAKRALAASLSHSNILAIHDFGEDNGVAYAVAELLEGATLRSILARGPLAPQQALDYANQLIADSPPPTTRASCTVTSSPKTCSSIAMDFSRSSISGWPPTIMRGTAKRRHKAC